MTKSHLKTSISIGFLIVAILATSRLAALETATHVLVNRSAVLMATPFEFERFLRDSLGLPDGSDTILPALDDTPRNVREWIEMGGILEDAGEPVFPKTGRYFNHFHDPLKSWSTAGLMSANPLLGFNESSVRWMQNRDQKTSGLAGGNWSWHDARRMYYQSLTEFDPRLRKALLAATFRSLGQMMHLVVDASNPDHSRNDGHPLASAENLGYWNYDKWILSRHTGTNEGQQFVPLLLANPIGFDPSILQIPIADSEPAKVPIARLIDSDLYNGGDPWVTFNADDSRLPVRIGLAEISNANFFSEDTLEAGYANPPQSTAGLIPIEMPGPQPARDGRNVVRRYWTRPPGLGLLPANPLRAQCAADAFFARGQLVKPKPYWCMDGVVWDQTASHMLPRAAGYARGVLEYFFRGSLRVSRVSTQSDGIYLEFFNTSTETMEGVFEVYARYEKGTPSERRERAAVLNDGLPLTVEPGQRVRRRLNISSGTATPYYVLVFRGRLGLETDAVVPQVFAVPFVQVVQESYDADLTKGNCSYSNAPAYWRELEEYRCDFIPVNHRIQVRLATNFATPDSIEQLGISRIVATWTGSAGGPAPLTVNGSLYPSGIWEQGEDAAFPDVLSISDPAIRGDSKLFLTVHLTNPNYASVTTQLATFSSTLAIEQKTAFDNTFTGHIAGNWRVWRERAWRVTPHMASSFRPETIGGFPAWPTATVLEGSNFVQVNSSGGIQGLKDFEQYFATDSSSPNPQYVAYNNALAYYSAIPLGWPQFPTPPNLHWHAVITELPLTSTGTIQFQRTFVSNPEPAPIRFTMTAQEAAP